MPVARVAAVLALLLLPGAAAGAAPGLVGVLAEPAALPAPEWHGAPAGGAPERVLVSLRGPHEALLAGEVQRLGGRALEDFLHLHVVLAEVPPAAVPVLAALPWVAGVYPEEALQLTLSSSRPAVRVGPQLWDAGIDGSGVAVAVVDSGIDATHPGLQGRVVAAVRVDNTGVRAGEGDRDGHGTHIAGIVAGDGSGSPGNMHAGMAPKANLVAVDISGAFTTTNAVRALDWLREHAQELNLRVVSNSWGREKEDARYDPDDPVIRASDALVRAGVAVVFSAGNLGPGPGTLTVEAQNPNVITVGAADDEGRVETYSSRGPARAKDGSAAPWTKPDLTAPGSLILSARAGAAQGGAAYVMLNGTSMAAPHVAGIAAMMFSADPALTPADVKRMLMATARDRDAAGVDPDNGAGFVDGDAAVRAAAQAEAPPPPPQREPFSDAGQVAPAAGLVPLQDATQLSEVRYPVLVPPGAVGLEFELRWDDPDTRFRVTLEKDGRTVGPFSATERRGGWMVLQGTVEQPLEPGTWTLVGRTSGVAVTSAYVVTGAVLVQTASGGGVHQRLGAPPPPFRPAMDAGEVAERAALSSLVAVPLAFLAARALARRLPEDARPLRLAYLRRHGLLPATAPPAGAGAAVPPMAGFPASASAVTPSSAPQRASPAPVRPAGPTRAASHTTVVRAPARPAPRPASASPGREGEAPRGRPGDRRLPSG